MHIKFLFQSALNLAQEDILLLPEVKFPGEKEVHFNILLRNNML